MQWCTKNFFSVKVVTSLYSWAFTLILYFSLALVLKYQKYGPPGQGVVCGEKRQRCPSSPRLEALGAASPLRGLELCVEPCCRQSDFMCDPATAPCVTLNGKARDCAGVIRWPAFHLGGKAGGAGAQ